MKKLDIKVIETMKHRNGISGRNFTSVIFDYDNEGTIVRLIGVLPFNVDKDEYRHGVECYVVCPADPSSSWRGDRFSDQLREAIER